MKTAVFSTREYDRQFLDEANRKFKHELIYHAESLHRGENEFHPNLTGHETIPTDQALNGSHRRGRPIRPISPNYRHPKYSEKRPKMSVA